MTKYLVTVTRDCTESTTVEVEAASAEEARRLGRQEVANEPEGFNWVADECSGNFQEPYATGADEVES
jgi:hypothetical protein